MPAHAGIQAIFGEAADGDVFASGGYASIVWPPAFAGVTAEGYWDLVAPNSAPAPCVNYLKRRMLQSKMITL